MCHSFFRSSICKGWRCPKIRRDATVGSRIWHRTVHGRRVVHKLLLSRTGDSKQGPGLGSFRTKKVCALSNKSYFVSLTARVHINVLRCESLRETPLKVISWRNVSRRLWGCETPGPEGLYRKTWDVNLRLIKNQNQRIPEGKVCWVMSEQVKEERVQDHPSTNLCGAEYYNTNLFVRR